MMAENPNFWWSLSGKPTLVSQQPSTNFLSPLPPPPPQPSSNNFFPPQYLFGASPAALLPTNSLLHHDHSQDHFPLSWSQLLMGGLASDQEESGGTSSSNYGQFKKLENWEDHEILNSSLRLPIVGAVKRELDQTRHLIYNNSSNHHGEDDELQACSSSWSSQVNQIPSAGSSCVTTLNATNVLDFSTNKRDRKNQHSQDSSEQCNGTSTSGAPAKKARVQPSPSQPPLKQVRKEKLGDRITALHQIVSPFGKTDTASVLLEAIGCIRFLEGQIEALSSPYLGNASGSMRHQHFVKGERKCINTEEPGQDTVKDATNDLKRRGLCLVPVSCTDHIDLGNNNIGSDYWAPALGGGGGGF